MHHGLYPFLLGGLRFSPFQNEKQPFSSNTMMPRYAVALLIISSFGASKPLLLTCWLTSNSTPKVDSLDTLDKAEIARALLAHYNKHLDETPFNNQLKLLTSKRDSASPLYLSLACEELRLHGKYETLTAKIRQLPANISLLLQQVLDRLEEDFGRAYTNALFMFLTCAGDEGLTEQELSGLMSLFSHAVSNGLLDSSCLFREPGLFDQMRQTSTSRLLSFVQTISGTFLRARNSGQAISLREGDVVAKSLQARYAGKRISWQVSFKILNFKTFK